LTLEHKADAKVLIILRISFLFIPLGVDIYKSLTIDYLLNANHTANSVYSNTSRIIKNKIIVALSKGLSCTVNFC